MNYDRIPDITKMMRSIDGGNGDCQSPFIKILNHNDDFYREIMAKRQKQEDEKRLKQELKAEIIKELMAQLKAASQKEKGLSTDTKNAMKDIEELKKYIDRVFDN